MPPTPKLFQPAPALQFAGFDMDMRAPLPAPQQAQLDLLKVCGQLLMRLANASPEHARQALQGGGMPWIGAMSPGQFAMGLQASVRRAPATRPKPPPCRPPASCLRRSRRECLCEVTSVRRLP